MITAKTGNGKKASCKVKGIQYLASGRTLKIATPDGIRTYHAYCQKDYGNGYYRTEGCVTTAVAIVASSYGYRYSPVDIHAGTAKQEYSERYALTKMGQTQALNSWYGKAAISVYTASEILTNMGIKNKAVYRFTPEKALKQIRAHLKKGKPVIIKANSNIYNRIKLTNAHHAIVIAGIDAVGRTICINPGSPMLFPNMDLDVLIRHHMTQASGDYKCAYERELRTAGGYILVG